MKRQADCVVTDRQIQALFSQALFIATETDIDYIKTCIDMAHIITDVDLDRCK